MKHIKLRELDLSRIGLGAMGILLLCLVIMLPFHLGFFAIAVALLMLARRERNWALAIIATFFGTLSLITSLYNAENLYLYSEPSPTASR